MWTKKKWREYRKKYRLAHKDEEKKYREMYKAFTPYMVRGNGIQRVVEQNKRQEAVW